jgi:hypothetical protein
MKHIAISDATYARVVRAGEVTQQDPQAWAEAILFRMASETVRLLEKLDGAGRRRGLKKRTPEQKTYALRRLSAAVDRSMCATTPDGKLQAVRWAKLWARLAGVTVAPW